MKLVVDASVAVKWFLNEEWTQESLNLFQEQYELCAPDHMVAEMANVVWKYHQRGELSTSECATRAEFIGKIPVRLVPSAKLVEGAMSLACTHSIAVYDALYVQLALREGLSLVTVDDRLIGKLEGTALQSGLIHLKNLLV